MSLAGILTTFCFVMVATLEADMASKKEGRRKEGIGVKGYIGYIVAGVILAFLASFSKVAAVTIAFVIGLFAIANREGKHRSYSWVAFLVLDAAMMLLSIARGWDKTGPKFSQLQLLLFPLFFIVLAIIKGRVVEDLAADEKPAWWNKKKAEEADSATT